MCYLPSNLVDLGGGFDWVPWFEKHFYVQPETDNTKLALVRVPKANVSSYPRPRKLGANFNAKPVVGDTESMHFQECIRYHRVDSYEVLPEEFVGQGEREMWPSGTAKINYYTKYYLIHYTNWIECKDSNGNIEATPPESETRKDVAYTRWEFVNPILKLFQKAEEAGMPIGITVGTTGFHIAVGEAELGFDTFSDTADSSTAVHSNDPIIVDGSGPSLPDADGELTVLPDGSYAYNKVLLVPFERGWGNYRVGWEAILSDANLAPNKFFSEPQAVDDIKRFMEQSFNKGAISRKRYQDFLDILSTEDLDQLWIVERVEGDWPGATTDLIDNPHE